MSAPGAERDARYVIGLDIGDGESALCWLPTDVAHIRDGAKVFQRATQEKSVITATARKRGGLDEANRLVIGEEAVLSDNCLHFSVNFKILPDPLDLAPPEAVLFAQALLGEFFATRPEVRHKCVVYVGHPAGWAPESVAAYGRHFGTLDVPVHLMPESQSALVHVRDRRAEHREGEYDSHSLREVLIVDVGSSTTDFTFVDDLVPRNLPVGSSLGCRQIDEELAERVQAACAEDTEFMAALRAPGGREMLLLVCRRVKEMQFSRDNADEDNFRRMRSGCEERFAPIIDKGRGWLRAVEIPEQVVAAPGGWADAFRAVIADVRERLGPVGPQLIVLTGGGSRMPVVREVCAEAFPEAIVENDRQPAFTVARGLASTGRHRVGVESFRQDIRALKDRPAFNKLIRDALLASFDEVRAVLRERLERELEGSTKPAKLLDELIREMAGMDDVFRRLRVSLESSLTPLVLEICRSYGVRDDRFQLDLTLPDIVSSTMKARIRTIWRTVGFSQGVLAAATELGQGGGFLLHGAVQVLRKSGAFPLLAGAATVAAAGAVVVGGAKGVEQLARWRLQKMLETAELEPGEVTRLVEQVAEAITVQMDARAVEIERFVF
ncbi:Hsp70 family protein [Streptomyces sp. NPDC002870]|uniref:Hsp70 family protein n=1 Tax=Streptomyces sp. NPDC002870 TaxID=3364666 RepID=UPI003692E8F6